MEKHLKKLVGEKYAGMLWFVLKTIFLFFFFDLFFTAYTGITAEGGGLYSPFLANHLNFVSAFRRFLLWGGTIFAAVFGYQATSDEYNMVIVGGRGVKMVYSCMGFGLMSAFAALILAWPEHWKKKISSLAIGLIMIIFLNMVRIGGLAILFSEGKYGFFSYIDHHDLFNYIVYFFILLFFIWHTRSKNNDTNEHAEVPGN